MRDYRFAEGSAIEAVFERGGALEGDMLLGARVFRLPFNLGVRVGGVVRVTAVSHRARIGNPIMWIGVVLFARRQQRKFHRHVCAKMAALVPRETSAATA